MPTTLTAPLTQQATHVTLDGIELSLARNANFSVNPQDSQLLAVFVFRRADGTVIERRSLARAGNDLPAPVRTAVVNLQSALITAARAGGLIPAGNDIADL
jgi:hypothetical protein